MTTPSAESSHRYPDVSFDANTPHAARRYDFLLGGKDNFSADRAAAEQIEAAFPDVRIAADENRRYVLRMVHHLSTEHGIRQYLDIGSGLPTAANVHDIAQRVHPDARIVYVDNDPVVAVHARALMTGTAQGRCEFIPGDLREPRRLLTHRTLRKTLNLHEPIAVLMMGVLHFIPDADHPQDKVRNLLDGLPVGSVLALSHGSGDLLASAIQADLAKVAANPAQGTLVSRTREQIAGFADGMVLSGEGVAPVVHWLPGVAPKPSATPAQAPVYGLLAHAASR